MREAVTVGSEQRRQGWAIATVWLFLVTFVPACVHERVPIPPPLYYPRSWALLTEHRATSRPELPGGIVTIPRDWKTLPQSAMLWRARGPFAQPHVVMDGVLVRFVYGVFVAVDLHTARERWRFETNHHADQYALAGCEGSLVMVTTDALISVDVETGQERWRIDRPELARFEPRPGDGHSHGCWISLFRNTLSSANPPSAQSTLSFLDSRNGEWGGELRVDTPYQIEDRSPLGLVLSESDGSTRIVTVANDGSVQSRPITDLETAYEGLNGSRPLIQTRLDGHHIIASNISTGEQRWSVQLTPEVAESLRWIRGDDHHVVAIGPWVTVVIDARTGQVVAVRLTPESSPTSVSVSDGHLILSDSYEILVLALLQETASIRQGYGLEADLEHSLTVAATHSDGNDANRNPSPFYERSLIGHPHTWQDAREWLERQRYESTGVAEVAGVPVGAASQPHMRRTEEDILGSSTRVRDEVLARLDDQRRVRTLSRNRSSLSQLNVRERALFAAAVQDSSVAGAGQLALVLRGRNLDPAGYEDLTDALLRAAQRWLVQARAEATTDIDRLTYWRAVREAYSALGRLANHEAVVELRRALVGTNCQPTEEDEWRALVIERELGDGIVPSTPVWAPGAHCVVAFGRNALVPVSDHEGPAGRPRVDVLPPGPLRHSRLRWPLATDVHRLSWSDGLRSLGYYEVGHVSGAWQIVWSPPPIVHDNVTFILSNGTRE